MINKNKDVIYDISSFRIERLFELAIERKTKKDDIFVKKYIELANKISKKNKVKIPYDLKLKFCKKCYTLFDADNLVVRKNKDFMNYICQECGHTRKIFVGKK